MTADCGFIDGFKNNHQQRQTIVLDRLRILYDWWSDVDLLRFILTLLCGGCNYTATKRISKTASITSISKTQRATRFNVWSNISLIALIFIMTQLMSISNVDSMAMRTRQLRKRHSIIDSAVDWENPCGGEFEGTYSNKRRVKKTSKNFLREVTRDTYHTLLARSDQGIDTSDIKVWFSHNRTYKFLPKLRPNSSIALRRWYKNMQVFVAAFSYLNKTQRKVDEVKHNNHESNISKDLKLLLIDARSILCEIESTINHTTPNRERKLTSYSLNEMDKRLRFRTKKHLVENLYQVDPIDLKFSKYYFRQFLRNMLRILGHNRNRNSSGSNSNSSGANDNSIYTVSGSISSNEINASRKNIRGPKRHGKKNNNLNRSRERLRKTPKTSLAIV